MSILTNAFKMVSQTTENKAMGLIEDLGCILLFILTSLGLTGFYRSVV